MSAVFGIHFGTTTSSITAIKDGKPLVLTNDVGDRTTPCIVAYNNGDMAVGMPARQNMIRNLNNTVVNVKQLVGRSFEDASPFVNNIQVSNVDGEVVMALGEGSSKKNFKPQQITTFIFNKLMETAKSYSKQDEYKVVISAPASFSQSQKEALIASAQNANFKVLRLINQSASPILAYNLLSEPSPCTVMVLRVGGCTTDASVFRVVSGTCSPLAHKEDTKLGGLMLDQLITNLLVAEFKRKNKLDCSENKRSMFKLQQAAEECKKVLSNPSSSAAPCHVESLYEGHDFSHSLSQLRLQSLSSSFSSSVVSLCRAALSQASLDAVDKVILVGGMSNTTFLLQKIKSVFSSSEVLCHIDPSHVISIGNALQAQVLDTRHCQQTQVLSLPCLNNNIILQTTECQQVLFPKGTIIPLKKQLHFKLSSSQETAILNFFEASDVTKDVDVDCGSLKALFSVPMETIHNNTIDTTFHFRHDGSLHVTCISGDVKQDVVVESCKLQPTS